MNKSYFQSSNIACSFTLFVSRYQLPKANIKVKKLKVWKKSKLKVIVIARVNEDKKHTVIVTNLFQCRRLS